MKFDQIFTEANQKLSPRCNSLYRKYSKMYHPDMGGDTKIAIELNAAREKGDDGILAFDKKHHVDNPSILSLYHQVVNIIQQWEDNQYVAHIDHIRISATSPGYLQVTMTCFNTSKQKFIEKIEYKPEIINKILDGWLQEMKPPPYDLRKGSNYAPSKRR
jgi:hypothetical protein